MHRPLAFITSAIAILPIVPTDGLDGYARLGATVVLGVITVFVIQKSLPEKDRQQLLRDKEHREELAAREQQHRLELAEREQQHRKEMQERQTLHEAALSLQRQEFIARIESGEKNFIATLASIREANTKEREQNHADRVSMQRTLRQFANLEKIKAKQILQTAGEREREAWLKRQDPQHRKDDDADRREHP